jgi:hypothetical protein
VVVVVPTVPRDVRGIQPALLVRLAEGGGDGVLVVVSSPTEQPPRAAMMTPLRTVLQQDGRRTSRGRRPVQQQSRGAVPTPVPVTLSTGQPAVTCASRGVLRFRRVRPMSGSNYRPVVDPTEPPPKVPTPVTRMLRRPRFNIE